MWTYNDSYNELYHYGRKGMKWYQSIFGGNNVKSMRGYTRGVRGNIKGQTRDNDIVLKKGTEAYRVQATTELTEGQKYVSFDKLDHMKYLNAGLHGDGVAMNATFNSDLTKNLYSVKMKLTKDIIAPSYEKTMNAFIDTVRNRTMKEFVADMVEIKGPNAFSRQDYNLNKFIKDVQNLDIETARDRAYMEFSRTFITNSKIREDFFNRLKKEGYNAVVDENDANYGHKDYYKEPVIIFDKSSLKVEKTKKVSREDEDFLLLESPPKAMNKDSQKYITDKHNQVLAYVKKGMSVDEIAEKMDSRPVSVNYWLGYDPKTNTTKPYREWGSWLGKDVVEEYLSFYGGGLWEED